MTGDRNHLLCPNCGYDLIGLSNTVCPECGDEIDLAAIACFIHVVRRELWRYALGPGVLIGLYDILMVVMDQIEPNMNMLLGLPGLILLMPFGFIGMDDSILGSGTAFVLTVVTIHTVLLARRIRRARRTMFLSTRSRMVLYAAAIGSLAMSASVFMWFAGRAATMIASI